MVHIHVDDKSKNQIIIKSNSNIQIKFTKLQLWCRHDLSFPHLFSHLIIEFELHIIVRDSRPHKQERFIIVVHVGHGPGWQSLIEK